MHLENDADVLVVVHDEVIGRVLGGFLLVDEASEDALVDLGLELEVVGEDLDFPAVLGQSDVGVLPFNGNYNARLALELAVNDAHVVARLEVLH